MRRSQHKLESCGMISLLGVNVASCLLLEEKMRPEARCVVQRELDSANVVPSHQGCAIFAGRLCQFQHRTSPKIISPHDSVVR